MTSILITFLRRLLCRIFRCPAVTLNLRLWRSQGYCWHVLFRGLTHMAKIGDRFQATVAPKNAAGEFAPVTGLDFSENTDAYDLESFDGQTAVFVAVKPGMGAVVTASAFSKAGVQLFDSAALPDVEAPPVDEEAVTLGLTVTPF